MLLRIREAAVIAALLLSLSAHADALTYVVMGQSNLTRDTGVEDGFRTRMSELTGLEVVFIDCATPDTRLAQFARSWVRTTLYADCLAAIGDKHIDGVIFWQGENDAMSQAWAQNWAREFVGVISGLRQDLGYCVPVAVAVLRQGQDSPITPFWGTVRALQANLDGPELVTVSTDGVQYPDKIHADYAGHFTIGRKFAEAMQ